MAPKHKPKATKRQPGPAGTPPVPETRLHRFAILTLFVLPFLFFGKFLLGTRMMFGTDFIGGGGYSGHQFMADYIRSHHTIAFWQPDILCGQPTVAAFYGDLFYPTIFLRLFLPVHVVWAWTFLLHTFLAGLGTYLFLKELKLGVIPATLAGSAYMLCGSLITLAYAGHDGRLIGSSLMPLALLFLHRGMSRRQLLPFLLCGLIVSLQLLSGHVQKVYYTGLILVAYFTFLWLRTILEEKSISLALKLAVYFAVGMLFAGALAAIQYLPIYGNLPYGARGSERGYEFATSWSMPIVETFDLLTPKFSGGLDNYWGKNPFKLHSEYLGILPLLFALIAVKRSWRKPWVKFFSFTFIGALIMAWGGNTPFYRIPYHLLPGINKFRGPGMIFFLAAFALCVLAGFGISYLVQELQEPRRVRFLGLAALVPLALLVLFAVARDPMTALLRSGTIPSSEKLAALAANYPNILAGLLFATVIAAIGVGITWAFAARRIQLLPFAAVIALVTVLDIGLALNLWNSQGYIRAVPPPREYFVADEVVNFLTRDTSRYRVLPLNYGRSDEGLLWLHHIASTGGQIPNPLQSYQEFIGAGPSVLFQAGNLVNPNFMNLLNVKYVIAPTLPEDITRYDEQSQRLITQLRAYFSQPWFEPAHIGPHYTIYRNKGVLPRAFIAPGYAVVKNKDEVISRLMSPEFDPGRTVLLYKDPGFTPSADTSAGTAGLIAYDANRIKVRAHMTAPGLLVLSENYHPDWKVTIDGKPAALLCAYHTLRAVPLLPGEHEVVFRYRSRHYQAGTLVSLLALVFLGIAVAVNSLWYRRRSKPAVPSSVSHS